jgi:hypothetical protein
MKEDNSHSEIDEAMQSGSLPLLRAALKKYPDAGRGPEMQQAIDAIYAAAVEKYRTKASKEHPEITDFMEKLATALAKSGDIMLQIHFTRPPSEEAEEGAELSADRLAEDDALDFSAATAEAARNVAGRRAPVRESRLVDILANAIGNVFPQDGLTLGIVSIVDEKQPALEIEYHVSSVRQWGLVDFVVTATIPDAAFVSRSNFLARSSVIHDQGTEYTSNQLFVEAAKGLVGLFFARLTATYVRLERSIGTEYFAATVPPGKV